MGGAVVEAPVGALFLFRPDLVEGVAVIKGAVFDDVTDLTAVVDVIERVLVEDDQVGDLADLDGAVLSMGNSGE